MKSLSRSTPLVRTRRSSGGQSDVNMCCVTVFSVMDSMSINPGVAVLSEDVDVDVEVDESLGDGEGGEVCGIVDEDTMSRIAVVISSREV